MKNPITIIIGDNERDLISFRKYNSEETISMSNEEFIKLMENL